MRKITVLEFITLDGVMQGPGGPDEDTSGDFKFGGWTVPYFDDVSGQEMQKQMEPADLLLGRKTFEIFAGYWPQHEPGWPGINDVTKYVVSTTLQKAKWQNSIILRTLDDIKKLKNTDGSDLQVWGSGNLAQTLLKNDLVDELKLKIYPITLGTGKRLFGEGTSAAAFTLTNSIVTPSGVIFADYQRAGKVETGSF
jgi:dihydrofolate reductase